MQDYDKNTIHLPRQDANLSLELLKNQGFGENVKEIYPDFTPFDNSTNNRLKLEKGEMKK